MFSEEDKKEIESIVCKYHKNDILKNHKDHFWGMLNDVSDNNISKSIEILRSIIKTHKRLGKLGTYIIYIITSAIVTSIAISFMKGFKIYMIKMSEIFLK